MYLDISSVNSNPAAREGALFEQIYRAQLFVLINTILNMFSFLIECLMHFNGVMKRPVFIASHLLQSRIMQGPGLIPMMKVPLYFTNYMSCLHHTLSLHMLNYHFENQGYMSTQCTPNYFNKQVQTF